MSPGPETDLRPAHAVMRILTVSDKIEPVLYGPHIRERVGAVDLVLACGDLPEYYLEYIVSLLDAPLYYVHGNHDLPCTPEARDGGSFVAPGAGVSWATNLHMRRANHEGLLLAGLEGCRRYNDASFQYSEAEVKLQTGWLIAQLLLNRLRHGRFLDILITHAPPRGIHDAEDLAHQGFASYLTLLRLMRPMLMLHGHQHVYNRNVVTQTVYENTFVINTYGYRIIELARAHGRGWRLVSSRG